jgi:hypothetical protein
MQRLFLIEFDIIQYYNIYSEYISFSLITSFLYFELIKSLAIKDLPETGQYSTRNRRTYIYPHRL